MTSWRSGALLSIPEVAAHIRSSLLPEEICSWHEGDTPLHTRGVRFSWLYYFLAGIIDRAADHIEVLWDRFRSAEKAALWLDRPEPERPIYSQDFLNGLGVTRALVAELVIPLTRSINAPLFARVPPEHRGPPSVFISHTWSSRAFASAHGSFDIVLDHHAPSFVWIDVACYNQHLVKSANVAKDMESLIAKIGEVSFILTTEPFFTRSWCLWEILSAHSNEARIAVHDQITRIRKKYWSSEISAMPPTFRSVRELEATEDEDRKNILANLISQFGSARRADRYIRSLLHNHKDLAAGAADPSWMGWVKTALERRLSGRSP